jgi:hypothetical protein
MKRVRILTTFPLLALMSACSWLYPTVPKIDSRMVNAPTVTDIVERVTCELADSLHKHGAFGTDPNVQPGLPYPPWTNLVLYNGVASVHLDLEIDVMKGFDPSVSYIDPITGGMMQSWSLAVSGQFNGTVTRHMTVDFFLDLPTLSAYTISPCAEKSGIAGNLQLDEALSTGLSALNQSSIFNRYPPPGATAQDLENLKGVSENLMQALPSDAAPTAEKQNLLQKQLGILRSIDPNELATNASAPEVLRGAEKSLNAYAAQLAQAQRSPGLADPKRAGAAEELNGPVRESLDRVNVLQAQAAKGGKQQGGSANTSFGTEVDFTIVRNIGGGPALNRTHWKIAGGGGAGGGGGGGAGGGGGGGGMGGGGGGGNMLNYNRSMMDSLIIQVALTCIDKKGYPKTNPTNFWETLGTCTGTSSSDVRSLLQYKTYQLPIPLRRP